MEKNVTLDIIGEKKENEKNSDSDIENEVFHQYLNVKNPNIPESLKTPENSQKKLISIFPKNSSKLILDNESINEVSQEILDSKNSLNIDSHDKSKFKKRQRYAPHHSYFKTKSSSKNTNIHIYQKRTFSYRRPFSKQKRKFIYCK